MLELVTHSIQDAMQVAFTKSNISEPILHSGRELRNPIQVVFEGLENQGYEVYQEAEGLRIKTPELADGTGGRWATISYESLSPGFFGFDNGEQLLRQIFGTVATEATAEAAIRTGAKAAIKVSPAGRILNIYQAGQAASRLAKMNRRFKRMGLDNQLAFSRLLHSATISTTKTARVGRFTGRMQQAEVLLALGANELYLSVH